MKSTCSRCVAHYDPNADPDAGPIFCGDCMRRQNKLRDDAADYQRKINRGDIAVCPENDADHRTVRRHIRKSYGHNPDNADTKMKTWRTPK